MTAQQKKDKDQVILAAVLARIRARTREEWQQMIDSYESDVPFQLLPAPAKSTRKSSVKETATTVKH